MNARTAPLPNDGLPWRALLAVLAVALGLRVMWAASVPVITISDSHAYDTFARNLVQHGVFGWTAAEPFAFWPPGTSMLYAAVYAVFGMRFEAIVGLNLVLSLGLVLVAARLAARWFGPTVGLATAAVLAVWPTLVLFTTVLASELPYLLLTMAALDVWTLPRRPLAVRALGAGVLLGAAALVRPQALALPVVYAAGVWWWAGADRAALRQQALAVVLALAGLAVVIAPWAARNHRLYGEVVLVSTNGGITFWMGNTPGTDGGYMPIPERMAGLNDREISRRLGAEARQYIRDEPGAFVLRTLKKFVQLYSNESIGVAWNADGIAQAFGPGAVTPLKRFTQLSWALIFLLALAGAWAAMRRLGWRRVLGSPPVLAIGFYTVVHSLVVSQDRYHLAFAGFWAMLVAWGVVALAERLAARRRRA